MEETKLTPMMKQYLDLKKEYQEEVLFFRLGDFYEMFLEDAKEVSSLLNITLTSRNGIPMCGIPYHAAKNYIKRLLEEGKKIAICEQVEMPSDSRSIAKREVVQVITPATVVEDEFLDSHNNSYLLAISLHKEALYCAYTDLSGKEIYLVTLPKESRFESLRSLFEQLKPKELLIDEENYFNDEHYAQVINESNSLKTRLPSWYFSHKQGLALLKEHVGTLSLKQFGLSDDDRLIEGGGALLRYINETSRASVAHLQNFVKVELSHHLLIDEATRKNLELFHNLQDHSEKRTLFHSINKSVTSAGSRLLRRWIASPLATVEAIVERQEWVEWFLKESSERERIRTLLHQVNDLTRLSSRLAMRRGNPSDLLAIAFAIATFFEITTYFEERYLSLLRTHLTDEMMSALVDIMQEIYKAIDEGVQGLYTPHTVIKKGYSAQLDQLHTLRGGGHQALVSYVEQLKGESGIATIKLSQNKIIGHYLEIPKTYSDKVPPTFYRKQTLVNAERYTTEKLLSLESEIRISEQKAETLERELYNALVEKTATLTQELLSLGEFFSILDVYQGLSQAAQVHNYTRPKLVEENIISIVGGRHPVVEQHLPTESFVPNDLSIEQEGERLCLITGPNMAGKSTYLRQNALIVLMAHIGSFVPAVEATIGVIDRLYCRVGASDNLARGESTFLVEMQEAAYILNTATNRSFAIVDEIGRGTSTQDGMSIAYAISKRLVDLGVKTLFATHYHELTMLDTSGMQLLTLAVSESKRSILFLKKVKKGVADSSYGLHVARLAGVPLAVIRDASNFQKAHFSDYSQLDNSLQLDLFGHSKEEGELLYLEIIERLASYPLNDSTPLEVMAFLHQLQQEVKES